MPTFYNALGSQTLNGSNQQDRFYAFTYDDNLNNLRADSVVTVFSWTTGLRTSATNFFIITGNNVQLSSDFFAGGEKNDFIYGSNANDAIFFNNGVISGGIGSFSSIEQIEMGAGDDIVDLSARGPSGVDYTKNIIIRGDAGNDTIIGGAGMDTIYGDDGNDLLIGWRGADTLYGGSGDDVIYGDDFGFNGIAGDDFLYGQAGNDTLYGGARTDRLEGGDGNDTLYGGAGGDNLLGGSGDDILYGDDDGVNGNDKLDGDAGNDQLFGGGGNDEMRGGTGDDLVNGGTGNDFVDGDGGIDILIGGAGDDILNGGTESDTAVYSGNLSDYSIVQNVDGSFTITDLRGGSPDGVDTLRNVEFFQFADTTIPAGVPNTPPVITSDGGGISASLTILENATFVTTVTASDADSGQSLTYSIAGGADAALFTIDPVTGVVSFINAPDFENPADAGGNNVYDIIVRATDNVGGFDEQAIAITVTDVSEGSPPVIISNGGGATASVTIDENTTAVATVQAEDADGTTPTYSIVGGADAALFTIDPQTGLLAFINAPDYENPADAGQNNVYNVIVQASDGINIDQQQIAVTVANTNDNAPVITSAGGGATASVGTTENATAVATVVATDADGATLTYSISGGADAALFTIDPVTGALSFITAPDFEAPGDFNGDNVYDVIVQASDGTNIDEQQIAVTVGNANDITPVITSNGGGATASVSINENSAAVTTVTATDADGTNPVYSIVGGADAALFTIDPQTGSLVFINAPDFEAPGDFDGNNIYDVIVQASDGVNSTQQQIAVSVGNVNDATPVITSNGGGATASVSVAENTAAITTVTSTDADGPAPVYTIIGGTDAALFTIDAQTGALQFLSAPDFEAPGDFNGDNIYDVIVQASDGINTGQQQIAVTVTNSNDNAPVISSGGGGATAAVSAAENQRTVLTVTALDADGAAITYSIVGGADAALFTINAQTGALEFIAAPDFEMPTDADFNGIYDVTVRASDGTLFDDQAISVTVTNVADNPPVIISNGGGATAAISISENSAAVTTVGAVDPDGTTPTYSIIGGADAALFFIDPQTGALTFINNPDFETPLDADANGIYEVIVRASDGVYFDDQALSVTVTDVNEGGRTITGSSGNNTITPTATNVALQTTALNDTIFALAGNDIIDGGAGADYMDGGIGDDTYFVDQFSDDGISLNDDQVIEAAGAGVDLVNSTVSYILTANVENLTLLGSAAINGTGNDLANIITGNAANNILSGGLGDDTLNGGDGNDTLLGGAGADRLDGGTGADVMTGGADNDIYFVDTFTDDGNSANDDQVIEAAGGGIDTVNASVSFILGSEVENLTLTGTAAINGTGNNLANVLTGNSAANTLLGLDGNDTINGNAGEDTIRGGNGNDTINGGADNDSLFGDAGIDTLLGAAGNDLLDGGAGNDTLNGQSGNDIIIGGLGRDSLNGGTEADIFRFAFGDTTANSATIDIITDFTTGSDKIDLDFVNGGISAAAYSEGLIATNSFTDALASAQAMLSGGNWVAFVAGSTDGWLFWDTNGDGVIDQSILLKGVGSLGGFDFTDIM
jgi:Ca2+-binding RTX toxin-like protein